MPCACTHPQDDALVPLRVGPLSRRRFLQVLGAAGVAGLPGCFRPPPDEVAPYVHLPEALTPGDPLHFATALCFDGAVTGVVVTSSDGRPTKIEGNPSHPDSLGAAGIWEQAALLDLYDPGRLQTIHRGPGALSRAGLIAHLRAQALRHDADQGQGLHLLMGPSTSPLLARMIDRFRARFPRATVHAYRPVDRGAGLRASRIGLGQPLRTRAHLDRARVVLALDADFFAFGPDRLRLAREWAGRRTDAAHMNRLYALETELGLVGAMADHRAAAKPSALEAASVGLVAEVARALGDAGPAPLRTLTAPRLAPELAHFVDAVARDLVAHRGQVAVLAGEGSAPAVQLAALALNGMLAGEAVDLLPSVELWPEAGPDDLRPLLQAAADGAVQTLICAAPDPALSAPPELEAARHLAQIPERVALCAQRHAFAWANVRVPRSHDLESWGEARASDGTVTLLQPLLMPLYESLTELELLSAWVDDPGRPARAMVETSWHQAFAPRPLERFREALQRGVVPDTAHAPVAARFHWEALGHALATSRSPAAAPGLELRLAEDRKLRAGEQAMNPWLQECPDPITQLAWDNALLLGPATAQALHLETGQVAQVAVGARTLEAPVSIAPLHAEGAATLHLGYGRPLDPGEDPIGVDGYILRDAAAPARPVTATVRATSATRALAFIQIESSDQARPISLGFDAAQLAQGLHLTAAHRPTPARLYPEVAYTGYRWALAVDLSRCTGCQACVVACRAENNVAIVGRDQVMKGREMHWLRVDRYFSADPLGPAVRFHPLACVHCENAPCEYVCPVNATVHSSEGLNEMVYNRCVGTRYCSNNCPYKVRRFNFFDYGDERAPTVQLATNPDVTVRSRGVMEKCSYCVQRIERVRVARELAGQPIADGDVVTACQQACPTQALTFGSLSHPDGRVSRLHADPRRYDLLGELGTRPRTAYLARLTHRNPAL